MSLGDNIVRLRNEHRMSQGDLAEKLNVSRQSISKWETDTSIPELDKLVMMSELFQISIDEIVRNYELLKDKPILNKMPDNHHSTKKQQRIGYILLLAGVVCLLLSLIIAIIFIIPSIFLILSGIVCLYKKRM